MIFGYLILFISVIISAIAAYYSVVGLTAIFAAAVVPVMIMGGALEAGKIVATVWLHNNWRRAGYAFKMYLVPAIVFLMLLTSMGIFGFLSKAHGDQSLVSGDAMARVAIYDEKIKISKDNIDANRKALKQMDEAVDQVMGRSSDEKGADKAVAVRRSQQKERARLQAEIQAEQKTITTLGEEVAPLRAEFRKVEAEVGPVKYIAALIYGDEASKNMLEAAVRWVIILIVIVFDPLALTLILAANKQLEWAREGRGGWVHEQEPEKKDDHDAASGDKKEELPADDLVPVLVDGVVQMAPAVPVEATAAVESVAEEPEPNPIYCPKCNTQVVDAPEVGLCCPNPDCNVVDNVLKALEEVRQEEEEELENSIWRSRMIARALDANEDARLAEEANAAIAEVEPTDTDVETVIDQAQEFDTLEKERDELQQALATLAAEFDRLSSHLPDVEQHRNEIQEQLAQAEAARNSLAEELEQAITAMYANESMLTVTNEEKHTLENRVAELEKQRDEMGMWMAQLESDLREAVQLAHDKTQELTALQTAAETKLDLLAQPDEDLGEYADARFGSEFPKTQKKGDMFLRVDYLPPRLFKWNGIKWIEIDKNSTDRYAYDTAYIKLLVEKLQRGEYDAEDLNEAERAQVAAYLNNTTDAQ